MPVLENHEKCRRGIPSLFFCSSTSRVSLLLRVPGVDANPLFAKIVGLLPPDWANNAMMIAFIWFGFIPGLAAAYSLVRANPIRWQLLAGGVLTLVLWFAEPWLVSAIAGAN